jgi:hypothetical protein
MGSYLCGQTDRLHMVAFIAVWTGVVVWNWFGVHATDLSVDKA